jgi:DNA-directed RNA polymerase beta subunit
LILYKILCLIILEIILLNIQRNSFKTFLKTGLIHELKNIEKITHANFFINFEPSKLKYKKPKLSPELCLIKGKTYSISVYIPMQIKYNNVILIEWDFY